MYEFLCAHKFSKIKKKIFPNSWISASQDSRHQGRKVEVMIYLENCLDRGDQLATPTIKLNLRRSLMEHVTE